MELLHKASKEIKTKLLENLIGFASSGSDFTEKSSIVSQQNSNVNAIEVVEAIKNVAIGNVTSPLLNNSTELTPDSESFDPVRFRMGVGFLLLSVTSAIVLWYPLKIWWKKRNNRLGDDPSSPLSHLPLPPGSFGYPLIGETFAWITQGSKFNSSRRKKYGNVFKTNTIGQPMVRVTGHEYVSEVLRGEHDIVTTIWPINVRQILGENVLVNSLGNIHRHKRKITCKAFTRSSLQTYLPIMQKHARRHADALCTGERPLVYNQLLRLTFDVAASTLLGLDPEKSGCQELVGAFYDMVNNIFCIPLKIPKLGFSTAMGARAKILVLLQQHMHDKKMKIMREIANNNEGNNDEGSHDNDDHDGCQPAFDTIIREMLLENNRASEQNGTSAHSSAQQNSSQESPDEAISDLALKEIAMELMFAGYFTSGSALTSCILELSQNPDVFRKLEDELLEHGFLRDETTKNFPEEEMSLESVHRMTYMDRVLKETLRVRPPVLGGYRRARKTFQLGGYRVPKGWTVIYNIRDTHEFEYEGMDTFDPDRFAPERRAGSDDKFKFIPFGGGPRTCIGREYARLLIKISLIEMFRKYRKWELASKKLPKMRAIPTLHPVDGLPCVLYPRRELGVVSR